MTFLIFLRGRVWRPNNVSFDRSITLCANGIGSSIYNKSGKHGFTLVELSIALVIIGLIVGGILMGQDLINAAAVRTQIAQIEKYNTATRTFQNKYGYLPGDMPVSVSSQFGFGYRNGWAGDGDGNGLIEGNVCSAAGNNGANTTGGETATFWQDLGTYAGLIDFSGTKSALNCNASGAPFMPGSMPAAKIGNGNYVYVWSSGAFIGSVNYFGISVYTGVTSSNMNSVPGMSVVQAAKIDAKIDDGLPLSGNILVLYSSADTIYWADGTPLWQQRPSYTSAAVSAGATTCFDNNGSSATTAGYSVSYRRHWN